MTDREAMQQALDALACTGEDDDPGHRCTHCDDYVDRNGPLRASLRARLAGFDPGTCRFEERIMTDRELMQQALEAIELNVIEDRKYALCQIGKKIRSRMEQPEQEPVATFEVRRSADGEQVSFEFTPSESAFALGAGKYRVYTTPPAAKPAAWVGLTDEDIAKAGNLKRMLPYAYARAIEKLLRSKNGGAA